MLHRAGAGDGGLEASGLRDQPVRHVTAVAVAADGQLVRIGNPVFHQRIDSGQYIFAGAGDNFRNDLQRELVSVAGRPAIVGLEHQPARGSGQSIPLIPIRLEMVAVGILRPTVNEHKQGQVLRFKFSRRIHQHAFDGRAVVGGPAIRLGLGQIALGEQLVERRDGACLRQFVETVGEVNLRGPLGCRVGKRYARTLRLRLQRG